MRICATALSLLLVSPLLGKDIYLSIAGSVGVFRTDTRVFNPSGTKDITVTAFFYPVGLDNTTGNVVSKQFTVAKRQMVVFNDIVNTLFAASGLGAIRLSTLQDDFIATSRIYAQAANGTLGQFVPGLDVGSAKAKGILIQLKATGTTQVGTFRTNLGFVNPNVTATTVTIRKYDANNAEITPSTPLTIPPYSVMFPVTLDSASGNLTDGWVGYEASQPIFGFASVVDNGTTDPTFITASEDTGSPVVLPGITRLYLSPLLDFKLRTTPQAVTGAAVQLCLSSMSWTATVGGDMVGTAYKFNLGVQTSNTASGPDGRLTAEIIYRRGSVDTVLASTSMDTTRTYQVKSVSATGPDPATQSGDTIVLRVRIASGLACVAEYIGPGTDSFIEIPQTTITN